MIDKIILSTDRKEAMIHFDTHCIRLYHSEAKVLDLIAIILSPSKDVSTWDEYTLRLVSSQEDTAIINIEELKAA